MTAGSNLRLPLPLLALLLCALRLSAATGDTTITLFDREPVDIRHVFSMVRVDLPDASRKYERIILNYTLECPRGGCDPWDRLAELWVAGQEVSGLHIDSNEAFEARAMKREIARLVTPYGKGGAWSIDVTDYRPLLTGPTTIISLIRSYAGGGKGYLLTASLDFTAGEPDLEPYRVETLWQGFHAYGDPTRPIEAHLKPMTVSTDAETDFAKVVIRTTGHGQGNTDGAGEFARKRHELAVNGEVKFSHYLWRDDCGGLMGLQYGTWEEARAGFCPGDPVYSWDNDISAMLRPGEPVTLDYNVEPYENLCRPGVEPCPCKDCNYNYIGHTEPVLFVEGQVIFYRLARDGEDVRVVRDGSSCLFTVVCDLPGELNVSVSDVVGNVVFRQKRVSGGEFQVDLSAAPGVYILKIRAGGRVVRRRIECGRA